MSIFCIRFSPSAVEIGHPCAWALIDDNGRLQKEGEQPLAELAEQAQLDGADRVIVLIAGDRVLTASIDVEKHHLAHIKQVIPSLVEEQLAEDLDDVHIAFPTKIDMGSNNVAVVSHMELIDWLDQLYSVDIKPAAIMPEYLFLPPADADIKVLFDTDDVLFQYNGGGGSTVEFEHLTMYMDMLINEHRPVDEEQDELFMLMNEHMNSAESDGYASVGQESKQFSVCLQASGSEGLSKLRLENTIILLEKNYPDVTFSTKLFEEGVFPMLAMMAAREHSNNINLLQGGYQVKEQRATGVPWKKVATIGCAFVLAELVLYLGSGWWFSSQAEQYKGDAVVQYKQIFPNERRVPNPKSQFQSHLNQQQGGANTQEFLFLLQTASELLPEGKIQLAALRFDSSGSGLMLDVRSTTIDAIESYASRLREQAVSVELLSAVENGSNVSGRLQVGVN